MHALLPYVIGVLAVIVTVLILKRLSERRPDTSRYPRDKVTLFQLGRGPETPGVSPFALKLETYLRMANIPYEVGPIHFRYYAAQFNTKTRTA